MPHRLATSRRRRRSRRSTAVKRARLRGAVSADVRDAAPARLGRKLDRLAAAIGLDVRERAGVVVEEDVELALLDALVEPGAAEDQPPQPMHQRPIGWADQLGPAVVDVLAERGGRIGHLAVDDEVDQVLGLVLGDRRSR